MAIGRNYRNIQGSSGLHISLFESQRPSCEPHGLIRVSGIFTSLCPKSPTFLAHSIVSNLAPVCRKRLNHTVNGSEHAVILSANSGAKSSLSSLSVRVHKRAAQSPPADVPVMTRGSRSASRKALMTPKLKKVNPSAFLQKRQTSGDRTDNSQRRHHLTDIVH